VAHSSRKISRDADILEELKPSTNEIVLDKTRNSAFIRTNFAEMLTEHKINHLIATGVGTNVCVESTVRDAWQNDFPVVTVSDATATLSEADHNAALKNLQWFGGTATVSEIEEALNRLK
jgi:ureidoacrylate peracid hydrolase